MSTRDEPWADGTPCWVDLMVGDADAAAEFYRALFGWESEAGPPETGGYHMCTLRGRPVAGIGSPPPGQEGMPPVWTTYLSVGDVEEYVERIKAADGQVMMGPMEVVEEGRLAVAADPTGAVFGLWEPGRHYGTQLVNEHGAMTWNECHTRDFSRALEFYRSVFGYDADDVGGDQFNYWLVKIGDNVVAGVGDMAPGTPPDVPPHWLAYFATDDTDSTIAKARELGAYVLAEPMDTDYGRMSVLTGPQGEAFAVIKPANPR